MKSNSSHKDNREPEWKKIHCSGCTDPDPLGGTHCYGNIEHGPEPVKSPEVKEECTDNSTHGCNGKYHGEQSGAVGGGVASLDEKQQECKCHCHQNCCKGRKYPIPSGTSCFHCREESTPNMEGWIKEFEEKELKKLDKYIAYCDCGDSLERTELYPKEATYYCFGCDKTFVLERSKG